MNLVAERIYKEIQSLVKKKDETHTKINKLKQKIESDKTAVHHTELNIFSESISGRSRDLPDKKAINDLRELREESGLLHGDEKILKELESQNNDLTRKIEEYRFWMHRADTVDSARQKEAEKKVFG